MDVPLTLPGGPLGTATGLLLILLGILALVFPGVVFTLLVVFFAVFALVISIELIRSGISGSDETTVFRTLQVIAGVLGIVLGLTIIFIPYFISIAAKDLFAFWAVIAGVGNILSVFSGQSAAERGLDALFGLVLAAAGFFILFAPALLADYLLVIILGIFAIITGIFSIWFARAGPVPGEGVVNHTIYK